MSESSDIDRLIEEGLSRYGAGDVDGALALWDAVLSVEPDNAQASSYVEYVRDNYGLLTGSAPTVEDDAAGFPIAEEPDYQVEITEGIDTLPLAAATIALDNVDAGWDLEEAPRREDTFEDATREYQGVTTRPVDADSGATDFSSEEYTGGFTGETNVRKRDLGFVQPTPEPEPAPPPAATADEDDEYGDYDLIESLPTPAPVPRDTSAHSQAEVLLAHAPTRELGTGLEPLVSAPTRDLGLRAAALMGDASLSEDDELPTRQSDVRAIREAAFMSEAPTIEKSRIVGEVTRQDVAPPPLDPIAALSAQILDEVDAAAPATEAPDDRTRRRIERLLELASTSADRGELDKAVSAVDLALAEDPNSALGQKLITRHKDRIMSLFQAYIGDLERMPQLAKPLHELSNAPISPRAAFLLSRIDGTLTVDELLDVSGMPRLEAYRHLCQLFLRGILR